MLRTYYTAGSQIGWGVRKAIHRHRHLFYSETVCDRVPCSELESRGLYIGEDDQGKPRHPLYNADSPAFGYCQAIIKEKLCECNVVSRRAQKRSPGQDQG